MVNFQEIEKKWQAKWEKSKIFEANPDKREKFFINFPYPYMNAYLHLGHAFSVTRVDVMARYKRMQNFNVLFPQGWHCTGTPVYAAAQRVREKEPKQIQILKNLGFSNKEIPKFENPKYWFDTFVPAGKVDFLRFGASVDWRRSFITTDMNPYYSKFVEWQFRKLKEGDFIQKGRHPVVWCPKDNIPIGDHDRAEGEGVTTQDFIWGKFKMKNSDLILMAGTTRPDAFYGQTNLWIDPEGDYVVVQVRNEKWVVGRKVVDKIKNQYEERIKILKDIKPNELIGKIYKGPIVDYEITALPAWFIDSSVGSGIVYSALEDPVDLFELKKIQDSKEIQDKYKLDKEIVKKLKPIFIIKVPEMGENLGEEIGKEFGVKTAEDTGLLEKAKGELNKRVFRKGIMQENCGKCANMTVPECQEYLKKTLVDKNEAIMFYELEDKVICRCLTTAVIKVVSDQWFLEYNNKNWKEKTKKALSNLKLFPEVIRPQFNYVLDWLKEWACTHDHGTGTKLPWDQKWLIESLSDSTIYMAYYTISHKIKDIKIEEINDEFFDFIFLNKGKGKTSFKALQKEFEYWYPFDIRSSGKDLVQNHLSFCLFNHTAIFPEKYWPKGFSINGWLLVEGEKMSKSKGNFFTIRDILDKYPADIVRANLILSGEGIDDPNFSLLNADTLKLKLEQWCNIALENKKKSKKQELSYSDKLFLSLINRNLKEGTIAMESMLFRTAFDKLFNQMQKAFREYTNRGEINPEITNEFITIQTKIIAPFCPHIAEELWEKLGHKPFISLESWPKFNEAKINEQIEKEDKQIETTLSDIRNIVKILKEKENTEKSKVYLYVIPKELDLYITNKERMEKNLSLSIEVFANNSPKKYDPDNKGMKAKFGKPAVYLE